MPKFKIGDRVNCINVDRWSGQGTVDEINRDGSVSRIKRDKNEGLWWTCTDSYHKGITKIKSITNMTISEKMLLVFKGEPQKSFIKAGVLESSEIPTDEGVKLIVAYMLKNDAAFSVAFLKDVVTPILAEDKKD